MKKQKVISFKKEDNSEFITVGEIKKHLENFNNNLPILIPHEAFGLVPVYKGRLIKYTNECEEYIELDEENYDESDYNEALVLE